MKYLWWKYPIHFLAYGFGTGLAPFAPGFFIYRGFVSKNTLVSI